MSLEQPVLGKVALVTGAASGNGRQIAIALAHAGAACVVVADLREHPREGGATTVERITAETNASAVFVRCDVTRAADVEAAVAAADARGGLDILVNNAGLFASHAFLDVSEDQYESMMSVNVKGTYFASQAAARSMTTRAAGGAIVNIGSISSLAGAAAYTLYCTSKGAVRLLTMALAASLGPAGIRVNMVCPGLVATMATTHDVPMFGTGSSDRAQELTPLTHIGTTTDIADAVVYLAGSQAAWVNGAVLVVDGGRTSTLPGAYSRSATAGRTAP